MIRLLSWSLVILSVGSSIADDVKLKAKARAAAALALEAEADVAAKRILLAPGTPLDRAKAEALEKKLPLVVWIGEAPSAESTRGVKAVHLVLDRLPAAPEARVAVFRCSGGSCDVKSSVRSTPSAELLRLLVTEASPVQSAPPASGFIL